MTCGVDIKEVSTFIRLFICVKYYLGGVIMTIDLHLESSRFIGSASFSLPEIEGEIKAMYRRKNAVFIL